MIGLKSRVATDRGYVQLLSTSVVRYRVSTPPLRGGAPVGRQLNIAHLDLDSVELMRVCPNRTQNDDCVALHRSVAIQQADLR